MKRVLSMALTASLMSSAAMAFEITGGSLVLNQNMVNYTDSVESGYVQNTQGSIAFNLGNGFGSQAGLSFGTDISERDYLNGDVHLTYAASPDVTLGAFVGEETLNFGGGYVSKYIFSGVEVAYTKNALSVQTAVMSETNLDHDHYAHKAIAIDAVYGLTQTVSLTSGLHVLAGEEFAYQLMNEYTYQYIYVGTTFAITPKVDLNLTYGQMNVVNNYKTRQVSLSLTYKFRKPALFLQRDSFSLLPGA